MLWSSEERESVLDIINQIVNLSTEQRKQFASILNKTQLENIIETISFIENRYRIIETLKTLIYDLDKFTNERDHISMFLMFQLSQTSPPRVTNITLQVQIKP